MPVMSCTETRSIEKKARMPLLNEIYIKKKTHHRIGKMKIHSIRKLIDHHNKLFNLKNEQSSSLEEDNFQPNQLRKPKKEDVREKSTLLYCTFDINLLYHEKPCHLFRHSMAYEERA